MSWLLGEGYTIKALHPASAWESEEEGSRIRLPVVTGCPCDDCPNYDECASTGKYCAQYSEWVQSGDYDDGTPSEPDRRQRDGGVMRGGRARKKAYRPPPPMRDPLTAMIAELYSDGWTTGQIAEKLNSEGITTPRGKPWIRQAVYYRIRGWEAGR